MQLPRKLPFPVVAIIAGIRLPGLGNAPNLCMAEAAEAVGTALSCSPLSPQGQVLSACFKVTVTPVGWGHHLCLARAVLGPLGGLRQRDGEDSISGLSSPGPRAAVVSLEQKYCPWLSLWSSVRTINACASCWGASPQRDRCQRFDTALLHLNVPFATCHHFLPG